MTWLNRLLLLVVLGTLVPSFAYGTLIYTGSLSTEDGLGSTGQWERGVRLEWIVEQVGSDWRYTYRVTDLEGGAITPALSHLIVEISQAAAVDNFWGFAGPTEIRDFGPQPSNPGIPGVVHGLKLDYGVDGQTEWSFMSDKSPVWGDFYFMGGRVGVWNEDFLLPDPLDPPQSGLLPDGQGGFQYKILRPDTNGTPPPPPSVPEPGALALVGLGLSALAVRRSNAKTR